MGVVEPFDVVEDGRAGLVAGSEVDWFNHRRLLEPIGHIPPAEKEANYHREHTPAHYQGSSKTLSGKAGAVQS